MYKQFSFFGFLVFVSFTFVSGNASAYTELPEPGEGYFDSGPAGLKFEGISESAVVGGVPVSHRCARHCGFRALFHTWQAN